MNLTGILVVLAIFIPIILVVLFFRSKIGMMVKELGINLAISVGLIIGINYVYYLFSNGIFPTIVNELLVLVLWVVITIAHTIMTPSKEKLLYNTKPV